MNATIYTCSICKRQSDFVPGIWTKGAADGPICPNCKEDEIEGLAQNAIQSIVTGKIARIGNDEAPSLTIVTTSGNFVVPIRFEYAKALRENPIGQQAEITVRIPVTLHP